MTPSHPRSVSLDVFRGLAILGMLFADFPGSWDHMYAPLQHAEWNGWTQTDLVFPFFLFAVGISITLSLDSRRNKGDSHATLLRSILRRTVILFVLGIVTNVFYSEPVFQWSSLRIMGVLQRIAIVYLVGSWLHLTCNTRRLVLVGASILLVYWPIMTLIPVPGHGWPDLQSYPEGVASNLSAWIDQRILGSHVFYWSRPWDPEGFLSTLPAVVTVLIGVLTGRWLKQNNQEAERTVAMYVVGCACLLLAYVWNFGFAINKKIWTSSYVLLTGGIALLVFATLHWIVDVKRRSGWTYPFLVFGSNPLVVFTGCYLTDGILGYLRVSGPGEPLAVKDLIHAALFAPYWSPNNASLAYTVVFVLLWFVLLRALYNRRLFLRL